VTRDRNMRKRQRVARTVERATVEEHPFIGPGQRYLVHPNVTAACAPSLLEIAAALRDETRPIDEANVDAVRRFVTDGSSAYFGYNPTTALWAACRLEHAVVGAEVASFEGEPLAVAV
jgi:hypothetical protein